MWLKCGLEKQYLSCVGLSIIGLSKVCNLPASDKKFTSFKNIQLCGRLMAISMLTDFDSFIANF